LGLEAILKELPIYIWSTLGYTVNTGVNNNQPVWPDGIADSFEQSQPPSIFLVPLIEHDAVDNAALDDGLRLRYDMSAKFCVAPIQLEVATLFPARHALSGGIMPPPPMVRWQIIWFRIAISDLSKQNHVWISG
jgi:hypothetical protein